MRSRTLCTEHRRPHSVSNSATENPFKSTNSRAYTPLENYFPSPFCFEKKFRVRLLAAHNSLSKCVVVVARINLAPRTTRP